MLPDCCSNGLYAAVISATYIKQLWPWEDRRGLPLCDELIAGVAMGLLGCTASVGHANTDASPPCSRRPPSWANTFQRYSLRMCFAGVHTRPGIATRLPSHTQFSCMPSPSTIRALRGATCRRDRSGCASLCADHWASARAQKWRHATPALTYRGGADGSWVAVEGDRWWPFPNSLSPCPELKTAATR